MIAFAMLLSAAGTSASRPVSWHEVVEVPPELRAFVEPKTLAISVSTADLDRDGDQDYVLVLERQDEKYLDLDSSDGQRPLLVIVRAADGSLGVAKRSERAVMCSTCGGVMGDPFMEVTAGPGTFSISHYGGSAWRWSADYRFNYSRRDATWQLVEVKGASFHVNEPEKEELRRYTPPKDFGKIDIADFDPEDFEGKGER